MHLFEIHLTTQPLSPSQVPAFKRFCQQIAAKPILIELSNGQHAQQPMISKVLSCSDRATYTKGLEELQQAFANAHYPISRSKVEVPLDQAAAVQQLFPEYPRGYYEWHGKVNFQHEEELRAICLRHQAHLSRNALKSQQDSRFITIRDYSGAAENIQTRVAKLKAELLSQRWSFSKEEFEYCLFDSNVNLDRGWINQ